MKPAGPGHTHDHVAPVPRRARQVSSIADVDKLVEKYRREGVDVTYRRFRFGGHMTALFTGVPGSLRFLGKRFSAP
jgi:hypothetical protein